MAQPPTPVDGGVLLVGSVPFGSSKEVFTRISAALPGRLRTIPDGEIGVRWKYVKWQEDCFPPETLRDYNPKSKPLPENGRPTYTLDSIKPTGYDDAAVASYSELVELRKQGVISPEVRFQICLPSPFNCINGHVKPELQMELEPFYEQRLLESVDKIMEKIPHDDMVIQWDYAIEMYALEYDRGRDIPSVWKSYFEPVMPGLLERVKRVVGRVPKDIKIAFHLCYGDLDHKHFVEPVDLGLLVEFANEIFDMLSKTHQIEWLHIPVPKDRVDSAYFEPLKSLRLHGGRLYLGLIHANDKGVLKRESELLKPFIQGLSAWRRNADLGGRHGKIWKVSFPSQGMLPPLCEIRFYHTFKLITKTEKMQERYDRSHCCYLSRT